MSVAFLARLGKRFSSTQKITDVPGGGGGGGGSTPGGVNGYGGAGGDGLPYHLRVCLTAGIASQDSASLH